MHHAGACPHCNWGPEATLGTAVEDFSGARCLAVLALLRAEQALRRGDAAAGFDDLVAVMALGRHLGQGKYVSGLAGVAIEDLAVTKALEHLGRLDRHACRGLAARLDALPPLPGLAEAVRAEQVYFRAIYRDRFAAIDEDEVERSVRAQFGLSELSDEARAMAEGLSASGDPAERMLRASGAPVARAHRACCTWTPFGWPSGA